MLEKATLNQSSTLGYYKFISDIHSTGVTIRDTTSPKQSTWWNHANGGRTTSHQLESVLEDLILVQEDGQVASYTSERHRVYSFTR